MENGKVVYLEPTALSAVQLLGPYDQTVPRAWEQIFRWLDRGDHHQNAGCGYGLSYDDPRSTSADKLRYVAGIERPSNWKPHDSNWVKEVRFPGGTYTFFRHHGPFSEVGAIISNFRDKWVPDHGLILDSARPVLTMYRSDIRIVKPKDQIADVCLPVMPQQ